MGEALKIRAEKGIGSATSPFGPNDESPITGSSRHVFCGPRKCTCGCPDDMGYLRASKTFTIVSLTIVVACVTVWDQFCSSCDAMIPYDGHSHGFVRMGSCLWDYALGRQWWGMLGSAFLPIFFT